MILYCVLWGCLQKKNLSKDRDMLNAVHMLSFFRGGGNKVFCPTMDFYVHSFACVCVCAYGLSDKNIGS